MRGIRDDDPACFARLGMCPDDYVYTKSQVLAPQMSHGDASSCGILALAYADV